MTIPNIYIQDVGTKSIDVPNIYVADLLNRTPSVNHLTPPVVVNIGNPIVNIPGCVKMHKDNKKH